jgi:hypothetical protein
VRQTVGDPIPDEEDPDDPPVGETRPAPIEPGDVDDPIQPDPRPRCQADPARSTVSVPEILDGESLADYEECLDTLGLTNLTHETLEDGDVDITQPGGAVATVSPGEGDEVDPDGDPAISIGVNPESMPTTSALDSDNECEPTNGPYDYPVSPPANNPSPEAFDYPAGISARQGEARMEPANRFGHPCGASEHRAVPEPQCGRDRWLVVLRSAVQPRVRRCVRQVVVEYATRAGESGPGGIITSFAPRPDGLRKAIRDRLE